MTTIFFMGHTVQNRSFRFFYNPSICMGLYWSMKTICLKTKISHYLRNLVCKIKRVNKKCQMARRRSCALESVNDESESLSSYSLCFKGKELEERFQVYQFDLMRHSLMGKFGTLSITTIGAIFMMTLSSLIQLNLFLRYKMPGSLDRIMYGMPYLMFSVYYQLKVRAGNKPSEDKKTCHRFVVGFVLLYAFTEFQLAHNVNDVYPEAQGCPVDRFRCPFTFSSTEAGIRGVAFTALVIAHLTVCISFVKVACLVFLMHFCSRAYGFVAYQKDISISIWSTACVCLQFCILIGCRYIQERHHRKKFLLQMQIVQLRANLQEVLDGMMPREILERVRSGETVIDAHDHSAVLFCSFPIDTASNADAMRSFLLFDQLHLAFDNLLRSSRIHNACKSEFVGNDYMIIFSSASASARDAGVPSLSRLAARMAAAAEHALVGLGLEVRFGLAAGAAYAAVIGETRRHLRFVGEAVEEARRLSACAGQWEVRRQPGQPPPLLCLRTAFAIGLIS